MRPAPASGAATACALLLVAWPALDNGLSLRRPEPAQPNAIELARGQRLLEQHQCGRCHQIPQLSQAQGQVGPTLARFGRRSYIAGQVPNTPELLARWIENPAALVPDTPMPALGVPASDARTMAAYLLAQR